MKFKDDRGKVNLPALNLIMNMEVSNFFFLSFYFGGGKFIPGTPKKCLEGSSFRESPMEGGLSPNFTSRVGGYFTFRTPLQHLCI